MEAADELHDAVVHGRSKVLERPGSVHRRTPHHILLRLKGPGPHGRHAVARVVFLQQVQLQCGLETKLISVSEPAKCEYAIVMTTPAACSAPTAVPPAPAGGAEHDEL